MARRLDNARALRPVYPETRLCGANSRCKVEVEEGRVLRHDGRPVSPVCLEALLDRLYVGSLGWLTDLRPASAVRNDWRDLSGCIGRGRTDAKTPRNEPAADPGREDGGEVELWRDMWSVT